MKKLLLFFLLSVVTGSIYAQTDSLAFTQAKWNTSRIKHGVKLKQCQFENNLFGSNQFISILEIKNKNKQFSIGFEHKALRRTSDFAASANALAAINGTFFDVKNGGSADFIKVNGQIINENKPYPLGQRARHQQAALLISNGKMSMAKWDGSANWEHNLPAENVMLTGPLLIYRDSAVLTDTAAFARYRNPRTAIALAKNKVLLITVDGRNEHAAGMSLYELEKLSRWLHASFAINLDGGGSTTMWVKGRGVVNHPSDNKKWDNQGERKVANVILLTPEKTTK
ncbi:phosphodiester glycosidase family protein [Pedobacter sp. BS3]|uniref:phosphodiester glycosidase family protein n=1 Tax=Pedobacter sp. BS3 TaxID=2567937 RepID=UPI0011F06705|nr:phosphodiester glycosidase family protein [Pedobacter sp. BS3]TZF81272.1 phosphodiester glycosidase family protein [Pedobacter sp. BS3]